MTSQQFADELLAEHQAARRDRERARAKGRELANFYAAERNAGASPLLANERMHFFAKQLDAVRTEMERTDV